MGKKDFLKKFLLKNKFVLVFNLLAAFTLLMVLFNVLNFFSATKIVGQVVYLFPVYLWVFLFLSLVISGVLAYYEKYNLMILPLMIWLILTTADIRTSNIPALKDVTTGDWTLGPDLDPYLFLRNAEEIIGGKNLGKLDVMRYAPLGAPNYIYGNIMPWSIVFIYKLINLFGDYSLNYTAIIVPVIFFSISILGFFFFTYTLFSFKFPKERALIGATIASFLYAFVPSILHRTVAGIPELESLGMAFLWFAFLFYLLAWKQNKAKFMIIYGLVAGFFTGVMSWTWGGYRYIYLIIGLAVFLGFLFNIDKKRNLIVFVSFLVTGILLEFLKVNNLKSILMSFTDTGFALGILFLMIFDYILFETKFKNKLKLNRINLPGNIISMIIIFVVLGIVLLVFSPSLFFNLFSAVIRGLLTPFGSGRVGLTVAENRAPYFIEVLSEFGYLTWVFFFGLILLFYEAVKHFGLRRKIILNLAFVIFIATFIFSRISPQHILNGENFISKFLYLGGLILFTIAVLYLYIDSYRKKEKDLENFKKIGFTYLLLISFSFWAIVSMRGAMRLFFIIAPIVIMIASYLPIKFYDYLSLKDKFNRNLLIGIFLIIILSLVSVFISNFQTTNFSASQLVPSAYNQQWQKAMAWVRENTAEESIFVHWWDYGYWVQTLGKRPTVSDGGHYIDFWDHTVGRYLLTTPKPETALSLMKTHNVSYLLIDSSDLGKYGAYASIGSDETGNDRASWIPVIVSDPKQVQETSTGKIRIYQAGTYIDSDINYNINGTQIFLPEGRTALAGIVLEHFETNKEISFKQPKAAYYYNNKRYDLPIRYLYYGGEILDFGEGVNVTFRIIPSLLQESQGISVDYLGAGIYLSDKTMNSLFAELYLMNDPSNHYNTIKLAHVQDDYIVENLEGQGVKVGEFLYYNGFRGPIKIWDAREIPDEILVREEFLRVPEGWSQGGGPWGSLDNLKFKE